MSSSITSNFSDADVSFEGDTKLNFRKRRRRRKAQSIEQRIEQKIEILRETLKTYENHYVLCSKYALKSRFVFLEGGSGKEVVFDTIIKPDLEKICQVFKESLQTTQGKEAVLQNKIVDEAREAFYAIGRVYKAFGKAQNFQFFTLCSNFEGFDRFIEKRMQDDSYKTEDQKKASLENPGPIAKKIETIHENLDLVIPGASNQRYIKNSLIQAWAYMEEENHMKNYPESAKSLEAYATLYRTADIYKKLQDEEASSTLYELCDSMPEILKERYLELYRES